MLAAFAVGTIPPSLRVPVMPGPFDFLKKPLMKEIGLILLIKLVLLLGIRSIWFSAPVEVMDDGVKVGQHVLGPPPAFPEKNPQ